MTHRNADQQRHRALVPGHSPVPGFAMVRGLVVIALLVVAASVAVGQPETDKSAPANTADAAARYAAQDLRVNVWVDKGGDEVYRRGELMSVSFQANADAYIVVYRIDADGRVEILWPISRYNDGFAFGGHEYTLPTNGSDRLRTASDEGVGYVQVLASRYPFDLRALDVDFHQEPSQPIHDYYVTGDPFLAMNEVNFAITGLDDPGEFVVSNYASYYVHRQVDHPRYLCSQCHLNDGYADRPYDAVCTIEIHHDYGWANDWWDTYRYYPVYYYPAFYYVDPWWGSPWVSYWYRPWYRWPLAVGIYDWSYTCYDWRYSPYWRGDCYTVSRDLPHRYRPLDKTRVAGVDKHEGNVGSRLVTARRPGNDVVAAMKSREAVRSDRVRDAVRKNDVVAGGRTYRDVSPESRSQGKFTRDGQGRTSPGLRVPERGGSGTARAGDRGSRPTADRPISPAGGRKVLGPRVEPGTPDRSERVQDTRSGRESGTNRQTGDRRTIRPVEPRQGSVWSGRRGSSSRGSEPARPAEPARGGSSGKSGSSGSSGRVERPSSPSRSEGTSQNRESSSSGRSSHSSGSRGSSVKSSGSSRGSSPAQSSGGSARSSSGTSRGSSGRSSSQTRGGRR